MGVTIVAAVARNGVIGVGGDLPWRISEDLRRFKQLTMGGVLVMGRKTYESIGRPLPGRTTVVITRQRDWSADGVRVVDSVASALGVAATLPGEVFVVGGGEIYRQTIDLADALELTEVDAAPEGDVTFPPVTSPPWQEVARENGDGFAFVRYERTL